MLDAQQRAAARALREQRAAPAEVHHERHHQLLTQRIDRRVGHLREALPDVGVHVLGQVRQRRDWGVVAHAPDGVVPGRGHRIDDVAQVLVTVPERMLTRGQLLGR